MQENVEKSQTCLGKNETLLLKNCEKNDDSSRTLHNVEITDICYYVFWQKFRESNAYLY